LDGLAGEGAPLPPDTPGDAAANAGFRIMAEAGALPREIELRKAVEAQRAVVHRAEGTPDYKQEMAKLADLMQRLAIEEEARRAFYKTT
jgi:hypothetical protein